MSALSARNVTVSIGTKQIVRDATLGLDAGELVTLVGPNGAGKTTLMRALAGLVPAQGSIALADKPLGSLSPRERARAISYLPQGHVFHWPMSVESIVMLGRAPHGDAFSSSSPDDRAAVAKAMATTETEMFAERAVTTLSGGEKARVALAKILYDAPNLLVLDEPTNHLDIATKRALVKALADYEGTLIFVSHDRQFLRALANRVLELSAAGPRIYGGSYDEYVSSTGREAPGMRVQA